MYTRPSKLAPWFTAIYPDHLYCLNASLLPRLMCANLCPLKQNPTSLQGPGTKKQYRWHRLPSSLYSSLSMFQLPCHSIANTTPKGLQHIHLMPYSIKTLLWWVTIFISWHPQAKKKTCENNHITEHKSSKLYSSTIRIWMWLLCCGSTGLDTAYAWILHYAPQPSWVLPHDQRWPCLKMHLPVQIYLIAHIDWIHMLCPPSNWVFALWNCIQTDSKRMPLTLHLHIKQIVMTS